MRDSRARITTALWWRIFVWLTLAIMASVALAVLVGEATGGPRGPKDFHRFARIAGERFQGVWDNPKAREDLARSVAAKLDAHITLFDENNVAFLVVGEKCTSGRPPLPVFRDTRAIGWVAVCPDRKRYAPTWQWAAILGGNVSLIFLASFWVARRLAAPLAKVTETASLLGRGDLSARVPSPESLPGEASVLAETLNEMADRVQDQLEGQRALVAAVSHEIRTPLARLLLLAEEARHKDTDQALSAIEKEVRGIDELVSDLLAGSRIDFSAARKEPVDLVALAVLTAERAELDPTLLDSQLEGQEGLIAGDPTLVACAMQNLIRNAVAHAGGPVRVALSRHGNDIWFEVEDRGPGLPEDPQELFQPFGSRNRTGTEGVGIGLSLVRRVAEAHGGTAWARLADDGGSLFGFSVRMPDQ